MAILWPAGLTDQSQPGESLRLALRHAVALAEASAGALALRHDGGEAPPSSALESGGPIIAAGIAPEDARRLLAALAIDPPLEPLDGRPRVRALPDIWAGEVATLTLADAGGALGEVSFLGARGFSARRALMDPARRQALVGMLVSAARASQELTRLRQENRQLGSILHFSGDGIITVDAGLRITGFNPAMEAMTSWRQHEALGRFSYEVVRLSTPQGVPIGLGRDPLAQVLATGKPVLDRELLLLARDGERVNVTRHRDGGALARQPAGQRDDERARHHAQPRDRGDAHDLHLCHLARAPDADRDHQGLRLDAGARRRELERRHGPRAAARHRGGGRPAEPPGGQPALRLAHPGGRAEDAA